MQKFNLSLSVDYVMEVEANTREEAIEKAHKTF
jgi:hypothetical protein